MDRFKLGKGAMPAGFKALYDPVQKTDILLYIFARVQLEVLLQMILDFGGLLFFLPTQKPLDYVDNNVVDLVLIISIDQFEV